MVTKKYNDKWSIATDDKNKQIWIDRKKEKVYGADVMGSVGKERKDVIVIDKK
ncbi:MAG: hypothetical protein GY757_45490 [bacterium]|nr:hypothetical protein [bacterium]